MTKGSMITAQVKLKALMKAQERVRKLKALMILIILRIRLSYTSKSAPPRKIIKQTTNT